MDRMTTSGDLSVRDYLQRERANWPALVLPLLAVDTLGVFHHGVNWLLLIAAGFLAAITPALSAKIAPFALFAYGGYGIFLMHALLVYEAPQAFYGLVTASFDFSRTVTPGAKLVLPEAVAFLAAGLWLLARTGAPGGGAVRRAAAQLRGTGGQPRTVPALLLLPVLFLSEELFSQQLWFGPPTGTPSIPEVVCAVLILAIGVAAVIWQPRGAAVAAVAAMVLLGVAGLHWVWASATQSAPDQSAPVFYGAVLLNGGLADLIGLVQGVALLSVGCMLAPRLLTWEADFELAERTRALTQRVARLTHTRTDATETAVAELRRIERDLHDGAQARLVAVGMSLRAAEQLMIANPQAALALVAEARETSSRAIDDLRNLVRGIYPPVLADRGLADAVRALALDAVLDVEVDVDLAGEPPMPVAAAVYFAVAEALTNAARHAGACAVQVAVGHADAMLRATVTDDGVGGADARRGTGLAGVERRLATFDGILAVSSPAGGPTIIVIEVPCALSSAKISSY
jgi:signal transduction histidine kinase